MATKLFSLLLPAVLAASSSATTLLPTMAPTFAPTFSPTLSPVEFPAFVGATMQPFPNASNTISGNVYMGWEGNTLSLAGKVNDLPCTECFIAITTDFLCGYDFIGGFPSFYFIGFENPWTNASFDPNEAIDLSFDFAFPWTVYGRSVIVYSKNEGTNTGLACGQLLFSEADDVPQSTVLNGGDPIAFGLGGSGGGTAGSVSSLFQFAIEETFSGELNGTFDIQLFPPLSFAPTASPTTNNTLAPTGAPTFSPTDMPTIDGETESPTFSPTFSPTLAPTLPVIPASGTIKIIPGMCNISNTDEVLASIDWVLTGIISPSVVAVGSQATNLTVNQVNDLIFGGGLSTYLFAGEESDISQALACVQMLPTAITKGFFYIEDVPIATNDTSVPSGSRLRALQESDTPTSSPTASPTKSVLTLIGTVDDVPENSLVGLFAVPPSRPDYGCKEDALVWVSELAFALPVQNTTLYNSYAFEAELPDDIISLGIGKLRPGVVSDSNIVLSCGEPFSDSPSTDPPSTEPPSMTPPSKTPGDDGLSGGAIAGIVIAAVAVGGVGLGIATGAVGGAAAGGAAAGGAAAGTGAAEAGTGAESMTLG